jgi:hypothetical protein
LLRALTEFEAIFEEMQAAAVLTLETYRVINEGAAVLHEKAQKVFETFRVTKVAEEEQASVDHVVNNPSVETQLGRLLVKKQIKIGEIVVKWDASENGEISKAEFANQVRALGVVAETAEIDAHFDTHDADGGGTLCIDELKKALRSLAANVKERQEAEEKMQKKANVLRRVAKKSQTALIAEMGDEGRPACETSKAAAESAAPAAAAPAAASAAAPAVAPAAAAPAAAAPAAAALVRAPTATSASIASVPAGPRVALGATSSPAPVSTPMGAPEAVYLVGTEAKEAARRVDQGATARSAGTIAVPLGEAVAVANSSRDADGDGAAIPRAAAMEIR